MIPKRCHQIDRLDDLHGDPDNSHLQYTALIGNTFPFSLYDLSPPGAAVWPVLCACIICGARALYAMVLALAGLVVASHSRKIKITIVNVMTAVMSPAD